MLVRRAVPENSLGRSMNPFRSLFEINRTSLDSKSLAEDKILRSGLHLIRSVRRTASAEAPVEDPAMVSISWKWARARFFVQLSAANASIYGLSPKCREIRRLVSNIVAAESLFLTDIYPS